MLQIKKTKSFSRLYSEITNSVIISTGYSIFAGKLMTLLIKVLSWNLDIQCCLSVTHREMDVSMS